MEIIVIFLLVLLNGFFALSELALVSSKTARLEQERKKGSKSAQRVLTLLKNPDRFLSAIQVGITLIGIITGMYGGVSLADDLMPVVSKVGIFKDYADEISLFIIVLSVTYVSIVLGELVPKTIAISNPEKIALRVAPVIHYFSLLFYPFVKLLSASTIFINRVLGVKMKDDRMTETEIRQLLKNASAEGVIEKNQSDIHEKLFYFSDKRAKHFMTHRTDLEWIDVTMRAEAINELIRNFAHSKIVCCSGSLENFVGYCYQSEYFKKTGDNTNFDLNTVIRKPVIIPETARSSTVLSILRQPGNNLCFVVNEYGGFEGIITLHDVMENIMGQFPSGDEIEDQDVYKREDGSYLIDGESPVEVLAQFIDDFSIDYEDIDYTTVAGFVIDHLNQIPHTGDKFRFKNYTFEIIDMDGNRIDKILAYNNNKSKYIADVLKK